MNDKTFHDHLELIGSLVGQNKLKEALSYLKKITQDSQLKSDLSIISSRYEDILSQVRRGTIEFENLDISKNKIRFAILDIIRELSDKYDNDHKMKNKLDDFFERNYRQKKSKETKINKNIIIKNNKGTIGDVFYGDKKGN